MGGEQMAVRDKVVSNTNTRHLHLINSEENEFTIRSLVILSTGTGPLFLNACSIVVQLMLGCERRVAT